MLTNKQLAALALGREKGTNHLNGIPKSEESKQKRSATMKAWCAANPEKVKARAGKSSGANHYRWNGGTSRLNTAIRQMSENRKWMDAIVRRDGRCQKCNADVDLEAHHIKPLSEIVDEHCITSQEQARECPDLWNLSNGIILCEQCHYKHHDRTYTPIGKGRRKRPHKARRSMAGSANPNYRGGKVSLICPQCENVFEVKQCESETRKYCSRRCLGESQRKTI